MVQYLLGQVDGSAAGGAHGSPSGSVYQFCTVCRYILVDAIDPTFHGAIDADYDPRYPDP